MKHIAEVTTEHVIVMSDGWPGYWGRGETVTEAVQAARHLRAGNKVLVVPCDKDAYVNDFGTVFRKERWAVRRGVLEPCRGRGYTVVLLPNQVEVQQ